MKVFSEKIKYGIGALFELAKHYNVRLIQIKEISKNQKIPKSFLEQLLLLLKQNNLVESVRGAQGGYQLKKDPESISLYDIIVALENEINLISDYDGENIITQYLDELEQKFTNSLKNVSLNDLLNRYQKRQQNLFFHI